jgi:Fic family protein
MDLPISATRVEEEFMVIEGAVNSELTRGGRFRTWEISRSTSAGTPQSFCPASRVELEFHKFCQSIAERSARSEKRVSLAIEVEWTLNAGWLHPFADGCGRISRLCSTLWLLRAGSRLPSFYSREDYYRNAAAGLAHFETYYRRAIDAGT